MYRRWWFTDPVTRLTTDLITGPATGLIIITGIIIGEDIIMGELIILPRVQFHTVGRTADTEDMEIGVIATVTAAVRSAAGKRTVLKSVKGKKTDHE